MTLRTQNILKQLDTLEDNEFQEVFYSLLQQTGKRNVFEIKTVKINNGLIYIMPFYQDSNTEPVEKENPAKLFLQEAGKFENIDFSDITEDEVYLQDKY